MDIKQIFSFVTPQMHDAVIKTATQLEHLGVRYALAGGITVGAYGYIRTTTDVVDTESKHDV
ncbi:hypothetical protein QUF64_08125 [Anaerolineales bacterium HSG6]|nr:hypothetical protein [Anaerolineales bacterium HSG6]MDM8530387.1 hypothetical protein [Anaerolineales bacterium HSG25]